MTRLTDGHGRRFYYLRLSVTEVCNFRCAYCLPDGFHKTGDEAFLTGDEVGRVTSAFAALGVAKIRLTGGEPTTRKDIGDLIARSAATPGIGKIAMTTNGWNSWPARARLAQGRPDRAQRLDRHA